MKKLLKLLLYFILRKIFRFRISNDFAFLFFRKEGRELLGRRMTNFWFLLLILTLTFFAVGFADGSLRYLDFKLKDPFMNWVSIDIPYSRSDVINSIIRQLREDTVAMEEYHYKSVSGFRRFSLAFWDSKETTERFFMGRTIDYENPLLAAILSDKNRIYGRSFTTQEETGLIVTTELLSSLGYNLKTPYIKMAFIYGQESGLADRTVLLPIIAVVRELPVHSSFLTTSYLYQQRMMPQSLGNPFDPVNARSVQVLAPMSRKRAENLKEAIEELLGRVSNFKAYSPSTYIQPFEQSFIPCYRIAVNILPDTSIAMKDSIYHIISSDPAIRKFDFARYYDYTPLLSPNTEKEIFLDKLTIEFADLEKITQFNIFLSKKHEINMEMGQVKALENYNFISSLTRVISIILIIFSIISIILFISNLLRNHLEKIKMNIGTFKAFGIDNRSLENIYFIIIYTVVFAAMILAFFISMIFGNAGGVRMILGLFRCTIEEGQDYFNLLNYWTAGLILLVLSSSYAALKYTAAKIFNHTPGDLIYDRLEETRSKKG
jgi:hypothetical protein